jgi:hypothetical protein
VPRPAAAISPPLFPKTAINIIDPEGHPLRNDNVTNFGYVGDGDGLTPPEQYVCYHPFDTNDPTPINAGEETQFINVNTGLWCRLAPYTSKSNTICSTQAMLCDQSSMGTATVLKYTGDGLAYNGVPLVREPVTNTLVLSSDTSCKVPYGEVLQFPPGEMSGKCMPLCTRNMVQYEAQTTSDTLAPIPNDKTNF